LKEENILTQVLAAEVEKNSGLGGGEKPLYPEKGRREEGLRGGEK